MTNTLPYKTKQFFFVLIKISIVVIAFYFIYYKLTSNNDLEFNKFLEFLHESELISLKNIVFLMILSIFNWFFEIMKWQKMVSSIAKITFKKALEQSLSSLTASLFTPNRIGEYGAKAIYFTKDYRKRIMLINLISNFLQMSVTAFFGLVGFSFFVLEFKVDFNYLKLVAISMFLMLFIVLFLYILVKTKFQIKGFSILKIKHFIFNYPKKILAIGFCLSLFRYMIFSFQFYYLLLLFGIDMSYLQAMMLITSMYFLTSIIPSIFIFDVIIKGSVAVYLFSFVGVDAFAVLSVVTSMWLFNFVLPSIYGSYFVLTYKYPKTVS